MTRDHKKNEFVPATRREVVALLNQNKDQLERLGIRSLDLFGSVARDELTGQSDVDLVVEFEKPGYAAYCACKAFLESLLNRPVDLLTWPAVRGRLAEEVKKDLIHVA
jgi:predicted nucleotidyltransferase